MKKEDVHLYDLQRILVGDNPLGFLPEVLLRTLIVYTILLFMIRWLGKRMAGQLTITEMAVMIMLGGIVSSPMQLAERGIAHGLLVLVGIVVLQRTITLISFNYSKVERLTQGYTEMLVKDGIIQLDIMRASRISQQQLFARLREGGVYNLGKVKRLYVEAAGMFSIYKTEDEISGLSLYPPKDKKSASLYEQANTASCKNCGYTRAPRPGNCPVCLGKSWSPSIK